MKYIITFILIFTAIFFYIDKTGHSKPILGYKTVPQGKSKQIAIVGDLQRTSIWELALGREQNDVERELIIKSIASVNPAMVVLLGDMVFDGSNDLQWNFFDNLVNPLKEINVPLYPVVGNHEYWGKKNYKLIQVNKRFPSLAQKTWYVQTHDSLALIFLNSNEYELSPSEWVEQQKWFNNRIYSFDQDPSIKGILVFTHHPPYTNSTITGDEEHVQAAFLPAFNKSRKTLAFFSGHAHTYERFLIDDKMFIISGGGGGPRVPLHFGIDCHEDLCIDKSLVRPFNYLLVERVRDGINIQVNAVQKNKTDFFILEEFTIPMRSEKLHTASD